MTNICNGCRDGAAFDRPITMAFHPILDLSARRIFAYEALVRGTSGESAGEILSSVSEQNRYGFDQKCRVTAIDLASNLKFADDGALVSINFLPNAVYEPRACIRQTLTAAMRTGFPTSQIMFEFTEVEQLDTAHLLNILRNYRAMGFKTAIDDFGAGYAGLNLLAHFQPDFVKLDMALIRGIHQNSVKQTIVRNTLKMLEELGIEYICEGIETQAEFETLADLGVNLMQGYYFSKPAIAAIPMTSWPQGPNLSAVSA